MLHYLCSLANPTEKQIQKIAEIVAEDSIGLVNMVNENGFSPLILMCQNNCGDKLIRCIQTLLTTPRRQDSTNERLRLDVNYQDRNGYSALHYVCKFYQGDDFLEIFEILNQHGIDVNLAEKEWGDNALQLLAFADKQHSTGIVDIVQAFIQNGINLNHKNSSGYNFIHNLCKYYAHANLKDVPLQKIIMLT